MLRILLHIFVLSATGFFPLILKGQVWKDPEWCQMLDSSDAIVLVEVQASGAHRAPVRALHVYKGYVPEGGFWVSGFSSPSGPADTLKIGERHILFLKWGRVSALAEAGWKERVKADPELEPFYKALIGGKAFYLWTPTAGNLQVEGDSLKYNLLLTTESPGFPLRALDEFEDFLENSAGQSPSPRYHESLFQRIGQALAQQGNSMCGQYIMMLNLTGSREFRPCLEPAFRHSQPETRIAIARHLGSLEDENGNEPIVRLLNDEDSLVRSEALGQIFRREPGEVGPILMKYLQSPWVGGILPGNGQKPVSNQADHSKKEIIRALGKLGYQPAIPELLPLLETNDPAIFGATLQSLQMLGSRDYVKYFNYHLEKKTSVLIFDICRTIASENLVECKPALKNFILTHNRNQKPVHFYAISSCCGLGHFQDSQTLDFLLKDFRSLLKNIDTLDSDKRGDWITAYIETFTRLKSTGARPLIYEAFYFWFGYHPDFVMYPSLGQMKGELESAQVARVNRLLSGESLESVRALVHLRNTREAGRGKPVHYDTAIEVRLKKTRYGKESMESSQPGGGGIVEKLGRIRNLVADSLRIPLEQVTLRMGNWVSGNPDERFEPLKAHALMTKFFEYIKALPAEEDLKFLKMLKIYRFATDDFIQRKLSEAIEDQK